MRKKQSAATKKRSAWPRWAGRIHVRQASEEIGQDKDISRPQGKNNPMYGRHHSAQTKKKISVAIRRALNRKKG